MKYVGLAVLALFLPIGAAASEVDLAFKDLPGLVAGQNRNVQGTGMLLEATRTRAGHLGRSFLPHLKGEAGNESFQTGSYDWKNQPYGALEAGLNLYRGGRDALEEDVRQAQVDSSSAAWRRTYLEGLTRARKLYWDLVLTRELIGVLNDAVAQNEKNLAAANRRIARGVTSETDRLEFQMFGAQLSEDIDSLEHESLLIQMELAPLLNMPPNTVFRAESTVPHEHEASLLAGTVDTAAHPDIVASRAQENLARLQGKAARRAWTPSVDLYGGYYVYTLRERDYLAQGLRDDRAVGLRMSMNLFDASFRNDAAALDRQAKANAAQADYQVARAESRFLVTQERLKHQDELVHWGEKQIELAKKYLARTLDEYDRGVKNSPDVLGAVQKFVGFRRQFAERRRNYEHARSEAWELLGK